MVLFNRTVFFSVVTLDFEENSYNKNSLSNFESRDEKSVVRVLDCLLPEKVPVSIKEEESEQKVGFGIDKKRFNRGFVRKYPHRACHHQDEIFGLHAEMTSKNERLISDWLKDSVQEVDTYYDLYGTYHKKYHEEHFQFNHGADKYILK